MLKVCFEISQVSNFREYNNTGMKPLNWKSPNQILEEYKKLTAEK